MSLTHAILGFLEYQPMSGYDLKKIFNESVAHFWSSTQSHIYKALETLEKDGLVESEIIPQEGKPNRKQYQITDAGRAEMHRWVTTPLPLEITREAWLIQLFFSHFSSNEEIVALLKARQEDLRTRLKALNAEADSSSHGGEQVGVERMRQLWQLTRDYGIAYYEGELAWLEKTIKRAQNLPPLEMPKSKNKGKS